MQVTLGISILLSLVVFLLLVSKVMMILIMMMIMTMIMMKILPPTSLVLPLIAKYLLFTFIMNTVSILVTVIIINWNFRGQGACAIFLPSLWIENGCFEQKIALKMSEFVFFQLFSAQNVHFSS